METGLYEAMYWLNKFIAYFETDYNLMIEDNKELMLEPDENLTEKEREAKYELKVFLNKMFNEQFPDIIEIILIYS